MIARANGQLPSVTTILSPWSDFSRVPDGVLAHAAERGTLVHRACACRLTGVWSPPVTPECAGYVLSFESWLPTVEDVDVSLVEAELVETQLGYLGHPDAVVRLKGDSKWTVIDLKTPAAQSPSWRLQLAAYKRLVEENTDRMVGRVLTLRLKKDAGRPIINESTATARQDFSVFLNALACWKYFNGEKS